MLRYCTFIHFQEKDTFQVEENQDQNHALKEASRTKLLALRDFALECVTKLKSKQGRAIRREKRATKLVATVMSRFFSNNIYTKPKF